MPLTLIALATVGLSTSAPLEYAASTSLLSAQRQLRAGDRGRALATLDSLLFTNGVSVAIEKPSGFDESVAQGLDRWNESLGEKIFRFAPIGEEDVTVKFVRSVDQGGGDAQGFIEAKREMSWSDRSHSYRLHATIFVRDNLYGRSVRADEVVAIVAHEAGHLLGLADIDRDDRLMGPLMAGHPHDGPADEEVAAVRTYRAAIRDAYPKRVDKR